MKGFFTESKLSGVSSKIQNCRCRLRLECDVHRYPYGQSGRGKQTNPFLAFLETSIVTDENFFLLYRLVCKMPTLESPVHSQPASGQELMENPQRIFCSTLVLFVRVDSKENVNLIVVGTASRRHST